jgi:DNA replication protein DnaC
VVGPSGTGKSHLLEALGHVAIDDGLTVAWFTIETLGQLVTRYRADNSATKAVKRTLKADLVVVDDIGLLPVPTEAAEALFRVIDAAYERRSVAISSNIHPGFDQILPATIATAAVDRFMHHAHVVVTEGDSYRFAQARDGKGVTPLP